MRHCLSWQDLEKNGLGRLDTYTNELAEIIDLKVKARMYMHDKSINSLFTNKQDTKALVGDILSEYRMYHDNYTSWKDLLKECCFALIDWDAYEPNDCWRLMRILFNDEYQAANWEDVEYKMLDFLHEIFAEYFDGYYK